MEQVYVFFVRECKPESLTGYAATKDSVLVQVSTLRSALQVQYQLGATSNMKHDIYSKLGSYELSYLGGFDDQQQAFDVIRRLDAEKSKIEKEGAIKEESLPSPKTDETPKEEIPVADVTTEEIVSSMTLDIQGEEEIKPFGPRRTKGNEVKGK